MHKMKLLLLAAVFGGLGCAPVAPAKNGQNRDRVLARELVGQFGAFIGHIGTLDLNEDQTYRCWVINGSSDGCLTVVGAGGSSGSWKVVGGQVLFTPTEESPRLVVSFQDATAVPTDEGIDLTVEGEVYELERQVVPLNF